MSDSFTMTGTVSAQLTLSGSVTPAGVPFSVSAVVAPASGAAINVGPVTVDPTTGNYTLPAVTITPGVYTVAATATASIENTFTVTV